MEEHSGGMGGGRSGPPHPGFNIDIAHYAAAAEWLKKFVVRSYGFEITNVIHDPYGNVWRCYDSKQGIIVNVDHELMQRLALVLEQIDWLWSEKRQQDEIDEQIRWNKDEEEHNGYE